MEWMTETLRIAKGRLEKLGGNPAKKRASARTFLAREEDFNEKLRVLHCATGGGGSASQAMMQMRFKFLPPTASLQEGQGRESRKGCTRAAQREERGRKRLFQKKGN